MTEPHPSSREPNDEEVFGEHAADAEDHVGASALSAITIGIAVTIFIEMRDLDARYAEDVNKALPATTLLVRVNRYTAELIAAGHRSTTYGVDSPETRNSLVQAEEAYKKAAERLDKAVALDSSLTKHAFEVRAQLDSIREDVVGAARLSAAGRGSEATIMFQ